MAAAQDYAEIAKQFGAVAQRYCALVDSAASLEKTELLLRLYRTLPELIREAIRLPDTDPWRREEPDDPNENFEDLLEERPHARMRDQEWHDLYQLLKEKLGDTDAYWTVFDPTKDNEAVYRSLADDMADIYRDLKDGLLDSAKYAASPEEVIWHWRFNFYSHWGNHAMDALRTVHNLLDEKLEDGEIA